MPRSLVLLSVFLLTGPSMGQRGDEARGIGQEQGVRQADEAGSGKQAPASDGGRGAARPGFHRGVCWVGQEREAEMKRLLQLGVDWISVTPFGYGHPGPGEVPDRYRMSRFRAENLEGIWAVVRRAHGLGLKVMIKPHLWVFSQDGFWRGQIRYEREQDWKAWFHAYGSFLKPYVLLAQEEQVAAFCIGTELVGTTHKRGYWTGMIRWIRAIYEGKLTYAAHWDREYERIAFWKQLDWIGVQGYFPLVEEAERNPELATLTRAWKPWMRRLAELSRRTQRRVLFTELGYKPVTATTHRPWEWRSKNPYDPQAQADAWEAFFAAARHQPFLEGSYVWKWFARRRRKPGRPWKEFTPQDLPAEKVIGHHYRKLRGSD